MYFLDHPIFSIYFVDARLIIFDILQVTAYIFMNTHATSNVNQMQYYTDANQ